MFAVIFEVQPKAEKLNDYLDLAKFLKPKLESIEVSSTTSASRASAPRVASCRSRPGPTRRR